jgi:hypothetical protein
MRYTKTGKEAIPKRDRVPAGRPNRIEPLRGIRLHACRCDIQGLPGSRAHDQSRVRKLLAIFPGGPFKMAPERSVR